MAIIEFLVHLFAASFLLLIAVRMVRKGIELSFSVELRRLLHDGGTGVYALFSGTVLAILLQGATAVILLASGLVSKGVIGLAAGLAIAVGADIGSAIVIRILTFDISWVIPVLLIFGGWAYLNSGQHRIRNIGRAAVGVALVLFALAMIGEAVSPVKTSEFLPAISEYLSDDLITAFILGLVFTFALHSSVASILVCVTLIASGTFTLAVGAAFILGANVGSALIPVWLTRSAELEERRLPLLNLLVRGVVALLAMFLVVLFGWEGIPWGNLDLASQAILFHLLFNLILAPVIFIAPWLAKTLETFLPSSTNPNAVQGRVLGVVTAQELDMGKPSLIVRRDVLAMLDLVSGMITKASGLLVEDDEAIRLSLKEDERQVNKHLEQIRNYFVRTTEGDHKKSELRELRELLQYAVRLEHAADIVSKRIVSSVKKLHERRYQLSEEGRAELLDLSRLVLSNAILAFDVVSTRLIENAEELVAQKEEASRAELKSRKNHFKRLSNGNTQSFETSDIHLDLSAAFKEVNSKIAAVAYSLLDAEGRLSESRLN